MDLISTFVRFKRIVCVSCISTRSLFRYLCVISHEMRKTEIAFLMLDSNDEKKNLE